MYAKSTSCRRDTILFFLNVRPAVFWRYWWNAGGGEHRRAVGHLKGADEFERENIGAIGTRGTQVAGNNGGLSEADRFLKLPVRMERKDRNARSSLRSDRALFQQFDRMLSTGVSMILLVRSAWINRCVFIT